MKKGLLTWALLLCCTFGAKAQLEGANWFFGDSVLLKFTEDSIIVSQAQLSTEEGSSTISDKEGNLLFYSNSGFVYNSLHEPIHEDPIFAGGYDPENPGQGNGFMDWVLLLPAPINLDTLFYLFTLDTTLSYTLIDRRLRDGTGGILDSAINVLIGDTLISLDTKLTSVRHGNGRDWWIFMRTSWSADPPIMFLRWLLTPSGFEGPDYLELTDWVEEEGWYYGNMFFSQDGERLIVIEKTGFEVYEFDRCSGEIEQIGVIDDLPVTGLWYGALSASGQKLYVVYHNIIEGSLERHSGILQYDLGFLPDSYAVKESESLVFEEDYNNYGIWSIKYEPITDNMYFTLLNTTDTLYSHNMYLHAITEPELTGLLCNVQENYLQLATEPGGMRTLGGLPNMPNYALGALAGSPCDTLNETNSVAEVTSPPFKGYPNPVQDHLHIDNPLPTTCQAVVYNAMGQEVERFDLDPGGQAHATGWWPVGFYSLVLQQPDGTLDKISLIKME
ncbi:MAG: hypothetical protein H6548_04595 [Chitinophagales bacterium]|nr:hypothetical protein [Chitinophagales bacterium]